MPVARLVRTAVLLVLVLAASPVGLGSTLTLHAFASPNGDASATAYATHALHRLAFGPRQGDATRLATMGVDAWIEQVHPERIDDATLDARIAALPTLALGTSRLWDDYFEPALRERKAQKGNDDTATSAKPDEGERRQPRRSAAQVKARQVFDELAEQRLLRAVYSERQLNEVLVDFWFNHFNVFAGKGAVRTYLTEYERDTIRPHVLGKFRDLLGAVAKSPAMLFYLDNWMSAGADTASQGLGPARGRLNATPRRRSPRMAARGSSMPDDEPPAARAPRGLNENYARELLELHTLGVDGGYTQRDVTEVARAFTGWTIDKPRAGGSFVFRPRWHDGGAKHILGHAITAGGQADGDAVLDLVARRPSTATFIATKLVRRLVADEPPPALVARAAATFRSTDGDLRAVVRTIVTSPEFRDPAFRQAKVKSPFEFVASALRATDARVASTGALVDTVRRLGMPLYMAQPPTGYDDHGATWVTAGALLGRMEFASVLAHGRLPGVTLPPPGNPGARDDAQVLRALLGDAVSDATRAAAANATRGEQVVALALGSPEFQRR